MKFRSSLVRVVLLASGLTAAQGCDFPVELLMNDPLGTEAVPSESTCAPRDLAPPDAETLRAQGLDLGFEPRVEDPDEVDGGLVFVDIAPTLEPAAPTVAVARLWNAATADSDRDCLPDAAEAAAGTSATNPDTDGDGWFDGPCNERRKLVVVSLKAWDEQEDLGVDETYLIVDDTRFPTTDNLDGFWDFDDGQSRTLNIVVASRVRGTNVTGSLATARVEGWEDDVEVTNTWWVDDSLFTTTVNLGTQAPGATFKVRRTGDSYDFELTLRVDVEKFADPTPAADADKDLDGISESAEFAVSRDMGGIADPARKEVFIELDAMPNRKLETRARRLVTTRLATQGLFLQVRTGEQLAEDLCLTRTEARALFDTKFQSRTYRAFRYAVMSNVIWNDASGVAIGDTFFVDDSTWWISGGVLAQAGTFIHELGHTLGLTKDVFRLIDSVASPFYDSAMNYLYQATKVDYSHNGAGGDTNDHNDWRVVDPAIGLRASFGNARNLADDGVCAGK